MSSNFERRFVSSVRVLLREHGRPVPYTSVGGSAATVTLIPGEEMEELIDVGDSRTLYRQRMMEIPTADVSGYGRGSQATIDGEVWTVHQVMAVEAGMARVIAISPQRLEQAGRAAPRR